MKKVTYKQLAANLPEREVVVVNLGEDFGNAEVSVKKRLTMKELSAMSADIVNSVIDMEKGEYNPEYLSLIGKIMELKHYAGISIGANDLEAAYRVIRETDLYELAIGQYTDLSQRREAMENARVRIEYMKNMLLSTAGRKTMELLSAMEEMMGSVSGAVDRLSGVDMNKMMAHLNGIINAVAPTDSAQAIIAPGA